MKSLLTFFAGIVTLLSPGIQTTGTPPVDTFVTLAESTDWGPSGAVTDMTSAVPQFTSLSESHGPTSPALPLDTTGWTTVTPTACTLAAFDAMVNGITSCNTVADISACSVIETDRTGLSASPAPFVFDPTPTGCRHGFVLRGNPSTKTILRVVRNGDQTAHVSGAGIREGVLAMGRYAMGTTLRNIDTWTWTSGQELNSTEVRSTDLDVLGVYPGDVIALQSARFTGDYDTDGHGGTRPRLVRKVVCAVWSDGTTKGDGCGGKANGTIVIDRPTTVDFRTAGPYHFSSQFTGQQIQHVSRLTAGEGGESAYTISSTNTYTHMGLENVEIQHTQAYATETAQVLWTDVVYGWHVNNKQTDNLSARKLQPGSLVTGDGSRGEIGAFLVAHNDFGGQVYAKRGWFTVTSLVASNPAQLVLDTANGSEADSSGRWGGTAAGLEIYLHFGDDCSEPALRGVHRFSIASAWSASSVTVNVLGLDGTGLGTSPSCKGRLFRGFASATTQTDRAATGVEYLNNSLYNTRIGWLWQGSWEEIRGYNECYSDGNTPVQRCMFDHEGGGNYLNEGNYSNGQAFVTNHSAPAAGPGRGPHAIWYRNQAVSDGGTPTTAYGGAAGAFAGIQNSSTTYGNARGVNLVWWGNVISAFSGGNIDREDLWRGVWSTGNLWKGVTPPFTGTNVTTTRIGDTDNGTYMSDPDRGRDYPDSLFLTAVPDWWCTQSGTFPNIGAPSHTASSQTPNLPASIRRAGTTCTPP